MWTRTCAASPLIPSSSRRAGATGRYGSSTVSFSAHVLHMSKATCGTCACCGSSLTAPATQSGRATLSSGRVIDLTFKHSGGHGAVVFGLLTPEMETPAMSNTTHDPLPIDQTPGG